MLVDQTLYNGTDYNTITTTDLGGGQKQILSVSNVNSRQRSVISTIQTAAGTTAHFTNAVQAGLGGFNMSNNSTIYGSVYSNGDIVGSNGAVIQGSAYAASSMTLTADQINSTPTTPATSVNFGNATATQDFAQSFQVSTTEKLNKVQFYIKKLSTPGTITVRITGDNAGKPSTTVLGTKSISHTLVATSYGWIEADFSTSGIILDANTTFWIVLDVASSNASKYYTIGTNTAYTNGNGSLGAYSTSTGGTWSAQSTDGYFKVWIGGFNGKIQGAITVTGNANAYNVTSATVTGNLYCQTGSSNNKSCNTSIQPPSPIAFPITTAQIDAWKNEAAAGGVTNGTVTLSASGSLGPRKIVGNLNVDNNKTLTVTGTLWVTGTINISNNAIMKLGASYGSSSGIVIADGPIYVSNNGYFQGSGATGSYSLAITTYNGNGAIVISNNAGAVILYAPYGQVTVSNNGGATQITAETLSLSNNASITYDTALSNASISSGSGGGEWSIQTWKEVE